MYIFTNPSARAGYDTRSISKRSLTGLNSEFSFSETSCLTKAEEPTLPYYLAIAGGRIIGFIPFPRVLVLCEMQSVASKICVCVYVFIYHHYHQQVTLTTRSSQTFFRHPSQSSITTRSSCRLHTNTHTHTHTHTHIYIYIYIYVGVCFVSKLVVGKFIIKRV